MGMLYFSIYSRYDKEKYGKMSASEKEHKWGIRDSMEQNKNKKHVMPLYRRISDEISDEIQAGKLLRGERLPAEAVLAAQKGVSIGTVKRAYADLEQEGYIYKVRGGGSYIRWGETKEEQDQPPQERVNRIILELSKRGLNMNELYAIALNQIQQVFEEERKIKMALVDCNIETLHMITGRLEQISCLEVEPYLMEKLLSGEQVIDVHCRFALVPQAHYGEFIRYADSLRLRTEEIALREGRETIARLTVIPDAQDICVLYRSEGFLESVQSTLKWMGKKNRLFCIKEQEITARDEIAVKEKMPFIIPGDAIKYSSARALQIIGRAKKMGSLMIPFEFEIDKGSLLHLKRLLEEYGAGGRNWEYEIGTR